MKKRFNILIEDDWEVMGNGLGNVAQLQYLPSLFFMKLAKHWGSLARKTVVSSKNNGLRLVVSEWSFHRKGVKSAEEIGSSLCVLPAFR